MKHLAIASTLAFSSLMIAFSGQATAQSSAPYSRQGYGNPVSRPTLSPYLNLLRGGNPAANYYMGVVPEFQRRNDFNRLNNSIQDLNRTSPSLMTNSDELLPALEGTGHATSFFNYGPYYGTLNASSSGANNLQGTSNSYFNSGSSRRRR